MRGPKEKKERSLGTHLHVKGERCSGPKCAVARRPYRPGVHGPNARRKNLSDFGRQLREKQKFKLSYGIDEGNLRTAFMQATRAHGDVATKLMELLERRLDNVIFRAGFTPSRSSGRQAVLHGHIMVNGRRVRSPGFQVKGGDIVKIEDTSMEMTHFKGLRESLQKQQELPVWLKLDLAKMECHVLTLPKEVESPFEVNLLVESFSK